MKIIIWILNDIFLNTFLYSLLQSLGVVCDHLTIVSLILLSPENFLFSSSQPDDVQSFVAGSDGVKSGLAVR